MGRVGEAPGLPQPQPRGLRGSSAARPSGRRRDPAGRSAETGFNIFTQHGECVRAPARGRGWVGGWVGGGRAGALPGVARWRGARDGGRDRLPSGLVTGGESHPSPSRLQPGWQLPGAEEARAVVTASVDGGLGCVRREEGSDRWSRGRGEGTDSRLGGGGVSRLSAEGTRVCFPRDWEAGTDAPEIVAVDGVRSPAVSSGA